MAISYNWFSKIMGYILFRGCSYLVNATRIFMGLSRMIPASDAGDSSLCVQGDSLGLLLCRPKGGSRGMAVTLVRNWRNHG